MTKKQKYDEGSIIAIPLRSEGWGLGVICRASPSGIIVIRLFARRANDAALLEVGSLVPSDGIETIRAGDLGLKRGPWVVVGQVDPWNRDDWAQKLFLRYEQLTGRTIEVRYNDNDPAQVLSERDVPPGLAEQGPRDGLMGAGYAEVFFTRRLEAT